ncbi:MAG: hypothetical protein LN417_08090 [Candidatus Thermoplasmatota archaeon]|nr:hypothetical protein [Candidatus Thermoplasmatota archaeon]
MKNQYFGDTRDLFKYDLVLELLLKTGLRRFTFIPMLTEDDETSDGGKTDYTKAGTQRRFLTRFLQDCLRDERRDIRELERLFHDAQQLAGLELSIHGKATYFTHEDRERYFSSIGEEQLTRSIIVVDPDNGLEVKSMRGQKDKYIMYEEVGELYRRMDEESVLIVFQFIPRVERREFFSRIRRRIEREADVDSTVQFVSDNHVVFFMLTKRDAVHRAVEEAVTSYAENYGLSSGEH